MPKRAQNSTTKSHKKGCKCKMCGSRRRKTQTKKRRGGGCGCGITGGKQKTKKTRGGSANLSQLPIRYYYKLNDHAVNPINQGMKQPVDTGVTGGKSKSRKQKKTKGGSTETFLGNFDPQSSFGTFNGVSNLYKIATFNTSSNRNYLEPPALTPNTYYA